MLDVERALLGLCVTDPRCIDDVSLKPVHFALPMSQRLWQSMQLCRESGRRVDEVTLMSDLEPADLEEFTRVVSSPGSREALPEYERRIRVEYQRRQLISLAERITRRAKADDPDGLLSEVERELASIEGEGEASGLSMRELIRERGEQLHRVLEARERGELAYAGIPTGVDVLDEVLGGLQPGLVTIVAGRPGMGKSAFARCATEYATGQGVGAHIFSLEDLRTAYVDRAVSSFSGIPAQDIRTPWKLTREQFARVKDAMRILTEERPWVVDDRTGIRADDIVRAVRRKRRDNGTRLVVVDYIQLLKPRAGIRDRQEAIADAMQTLAKAAREDDIAYVVLSQLNRNCEYRDDKRPMLADLRQAGELEEYSKCVLFLYRDAVYNPSAKQDEVEILIPKNSNGKTGSVVARWDGPTTRIN